MAVVQDVGWLMISVSLISFFLTLGTMGANPTLMLMKAYRLTKCCRPVSNDLSDGVCESIARVFESNFRTSGNCTNQDFFLDHVYRFHP